MRLIDAYAHLFLYRNRVATVPLRGISLQRRKTWSVKSNCSMVIQPTQSEFGVLNLICCNICNGGLTKYIQNTASWLMSPILVLLYLARTRRLMQVYEKLVFNNDVFSSNMYRSRRLNPWTTLQRANTGSVSVILAKRNGSTRTRLSLMARVPLNHLFLRVWTVRERERHSSQQTLKVWYMCLLLVPMPASSVSKPTAIPTAAVSSSAALKTASSAAGSAKFTLSSKSGGAGTHATAGPASENKEANAKSAESSAAAAGKQQSTWMLALAGVAAVAAYSF